MTRNNTIQQNTGGFINRLLTEETLIAPGICIVTCEKVGTFDYKYVFLDSDLGLKCFKVWLKKEYQELHWHERQKLLQYILGSKINTKNL